MGSIVEESSDMALETTKTVKMVYGENYIGSGLHFRNGDVATVTIAVAKKLLGLKTPTGHNRFTLYDAEVDSSNGVVVTAPSKVVQDPYSMRNTIELRAWLKERGIITPATSTLEVLKSKIPKDFDIRQEVEEPPKDNDEDDIIVE